MNKFSFGVARAQNFTVARVYFFTEALTEFLHGNVKYILYHKLFFFH